jgi:hypothetical protein
VSVNNSSSFDKIPAEMKKYNQWVVWKLEDNGGKKPTKIPYSITGQKASVTNPNTWATFDQAVLAVSSGWFSGIGFVLTENDPYAFIDFDDTKGDREQTELQEAIYKDVPTYAELSPSGTGLHLIVKGKVPTGKRKKSIEVYSNDRYMTMTGNVYRNSPIIECQWALCALYTKLGGGSESEQVTTQDNAQTESDKVIIDRAANASNGELFSKLWAGDWQGLYPSQSEADMALVDIIAFYTENKDQVKRMFLQSALGERDKAKRSQYMKYMLDKCFDNKLPPVDISGLKQQLEKVKEVEQLEPQTEPLKEIYTPPPGLLGEIAKFIYDAAPRPVPEIALAGAIGMLAGITGRAYNVNGTGLNQYTLLLAPTGTGKDSISSGIDRLFIEVSKVVPSASEFLGPPEIASSQAITKYMSTGPKSFVSIVGEFGMKLQQMINYNASPHLQGFHRFLLDTYGKSGQHKMLGSTIYADKDKTTAAIKSPAFSLLGESTPHKFYEKLHEGLISDGLLPRFLIIEYLGKRPPASKTFRQAKPNPQMLEELTNLFANSLKLNNENQAIDVDFSPEAHALFDKFDIYCDNQINSSEMEVRRQLWNRAHLKSLKLAALVAVGCNSSFPTITEEMANWAMDIVVADVKNLLGRFTRGEIDDDEKQQLNKTIRVCKKFVVSPWSAVEKSSKGMEHLHADRVVPYAYIHKNLTAVSVFRNDRFGSTAAIKKALQTLMDSGDVEEISKQQIKAKYNKSCKAYAIKNLSTFGLEI